ncbi:hypothetical protein MKX03_004702, partial [Papaver bracteatum]
MVTFEAEDDIMFLDSTSVESFNLDEIDFSTSFEEGGVIESYLTVPLFVNDQKGDFSINDQSNTQEINCLFKLSVLCGDDSKWRIIVRNGWHSHDPPESLMGHVTLSLSEKEYQRVVQLYSDGAKPATILTTMQREFPGIVHHIKTIYNAILKSQRILGNGRTLVQEFKN